MILNPIIKSYISIWPLIIDISICRGSQKSDMVELENILKRLENIIKQKHAFQV